MGQPIDGGRTSDPIEAACIKCGQAHDPARCQGHVDDAKQAAYRQGGLAARRQARGALRQCGRRPRKGQTVCSAHGGAAPRAEMAAEAVLSMQSARRAMESYGQKLDTNPVDALLDEVRWTAGHVAWLRDRVREIEQEALVWGKTEAVEKQASEFPGVDITEAARPNVWLTLYQQERKHLVDVCKAAISAGIEERRVRLAEQQGEVIVGVIQAILGDLGLSPEQQALVPEVVPRRLRAVA